MGEREDLFAELTRSPLDSPPDRRRPAHPRRRLPGWMTWLGGLLAGALLVGVGYVIGGSRSEPVIAATTTIAVAPPTTAPAAVPYPDGYVPVTDLIALRPEFHVTNGSQLLIGFSTAVRRGFDPAMSETFTGGRWELELEDGTIIPSTAYSIAPTGSVTVSFDLGSRKVQDVARIRMTDRGVPEVDEFTFDATGPLPAGLSTTQRFAVADGVELAIAPFELTADGATIEWSMTDPRILATVDIVAFLKRGSDVVAVASGTDSRFFPDNQVEAGSSDGVLFIRPDSFDGKVDRIDFRVEVRWMVPLPVGVEFPFPETGR